MLLKLIKNDIKQNKLIGLGIIGFMVITGLYVTITSGLYNYLIGKEYIIENDLISVFANIFIYSPIMFIEYLESLKIFPIFIAVGLIQIPLIISLMGEKAYVTMVLPVSMKNIIKSKIIVTIIWSFIFLVLFELLFLLMMATRNNIGILEAVFNPYRFNYAITQMCLRMAIAIYYTTLVYFAVVFVEKNKYLAFGMGVMHLWLPAFFGIVSLPMFSIIYTSQENLFELISNDHAYLYETVNYLGTSLILYLIIACKVKKGINIK